MIITKHVLTNVEYLTFKVKLCFKVRIRLCFSHAVCVCVFSNKVDAKHVLLWFANQISYTR